MRPQALYVISVNPGYGIHKKKAMVYCPVAVSQSWKYKESSQIFSNTKKS